MKDLTLALMTGVDIPIPECKLVLHQPTFKEIALMGEREYFIALQILCVSGINKEGLEKANDFQIFMALISDKEGAERKQYVIDAFFLLFPNYKVHIMPRALLFNLENENSIIDENNFSSLQEVLRQVNCLSGKATDGFNAKSAAAMKIAQKLERGRQRVAAQKQGAGNNSSVFSQYLSVLTVGLHIPLTSLIEHTVYQLNDLVERYTLYVNWDLYIRQCLAGGKPDKEPDDWRKTIH